jgi:hypothetical protein
MSKRSLLSIGLVLSLAGVAAADPIAGFTFPDLSTGTPTTDPAAYEPDTVGANVAVSGIIAGSGMTGIVEVSNPSPNYASQPVLRVDSASTTLSSSVSNNRYFEFTVTPAAGVELDLDTLTFDVGRGGSSAARGFGLFTSETGFALGDEIFLEPGVPAQRPNMTSYSIDLSGMDFQGLTAPITFRFNVFAPGTGQSLEFDNIQLTGSALVPEPSSLAAWLMFGGLGCVVASRVRRAKRS